MKRHRLAHTYAKSAHVVTWCGRVVTPDRIVMPEDIGTERECRTCQKAFLKSLTYYDADTSVSRTR